MNHTSKVIAGIGIWIFILATCIALWSFIPQQQYTSMMMWATQQKNKYFSQPLKVKVAFDDWIVLRSGDKVYLNDSDDSSQRIEIGAIYNKTYDEQRNKWILHVHLYPEYKSRIGVESSFFLVSEPGSSSWVISKLLPTQRRKELLDILEEYLRIHTKDTQEKLLPILSEITKESYTLLQKNFTEVIEKNKKELIDKLKEAEKKHLNKEMQVLWDDVVWPIILEESDPVIAPIVEKLWSKFPKAKIVMLWIYQSLPGTDNDHVQKKDRELS